jgi:hypothetical protein
MKTILAGSLIIMILMAAAAARAEVIPGRWEKVEALAPGTAVIVMIQGGERLETSFGSISPDEIIFKEPSGTERRLPRIAIQKIESAAIVRDRLRNGALWGLAAGAAAGILGVVAFGESVTEGPVDWGGEDGPGYLVGGALVGGGIGAALGAIIDASVKHREVLYKAK